MYRHNFNINEETDSLNITENINPLLCFGDNNASVNLSISGGISPYNEIWANGITPNNLGPGIYSYTIIDSNGCTVNDSIIILEPIELTSTISSVNITNCIIDDGAIDLNVGGVQDKYHIHGIMAQQMRIWLIYLLEPILLLFQTPMVVF